MREMLELKRAALEALIAELPPSVQEWARRTVAESVAAIVGDEGVVRVKFILPITPGALFCPLSGTKLQQLGSKRCPEGCHVTTFTLCEACDQVFAAEADN